MYLSRRLFLIYYKVLIFIIYHLFLNILLIYKLYQEDNICSKNFSDHAFFLFGNLY